jgi:hypothetical protein
MDYGLYQFFFKEMQAVRLKVKLKEERSTEGRGDGMINIGSRAPLFPCAKYSSAMYSRVLWQQVFTPPAYTEQNIENTNYTLKLFLSARNYSLPR